jgi:phage gp45-like
VSALTDQIARMLSKAIAPLQRRVRLMVARGVVELVSESKKIQQLQISTHADIVRDDVERFQQYGMSSHPEPGAEAIVLSVGGTADHPVVIAVDDRRYRPKTLEEGEVALYTKDGIRVICKADGIVEIGTEPSEFVALADKTKTELDKIINYLTAIHAVWQSPIPEAGMGAPSSLGTALMAATASGVPSISAPAAEETKAK